jgi:tripartite-type tricarboxylate transporter receptor subunit TctC
MRRFAGAALAVVACIAAATPAPAQTYPSRAITIVVPFPAGGPTDTTAREIANALQAKFKQNVVVENVTGGSTTIATNKVAHAAPDGYTLLLHNLAIAANVSLFKNLPFNTEKDLTPVILINKDPLVLVGRNSLAPKNLSELLALMKTQTLKAAIPGYGTTSHLATTLLAQQAKVSIDQIPYRGATPAVTDLLGGHVDLLIIAPQAIVPQVNAGKLKAYAVTAKEKSAQLPTAESLAAVLGPRFDIVYWQGLFAPSGTPPETIKIINAAVQEAVADPAVVKKWANEGFDIFPKDQQSQEAAKAFFNSEVARWGEVIRDNNIQVTP